jgi:putative oxidoreductase
MRLMIGVVFFTSGWKDLEDPRTRSKDIEMSEGFTVFLGLAESAGSLGVKAGVMVQLAAAGLILIMLCAIAKKLLVWHSRFWGSTALMAGARSAS